MRTIGLFGKMRASGDFVGLKTPPAFRAVRRFLQLGHEQAGGRVPEEPVYFVSRFPDCRETLCGSFIVSEDAVGRRFPLVSFLPIEDTLVTASRGVLPAIIQPFLDAAVARMRAGKGASYAALERALRAVPRPDATLLSRVVARCGQASEAESVSSFVKRVFGDGGAAQLAYALHAVDLACTPLRGEVPDEASVSLDCPMAIDLDLYFWADLIHRKLGWRHDGPGLFWTEQTPRLIVVLGPATPAVLTHLVSERPSSSLWPLWTARCDALQNARDSLPGTVRQAIDADRSLHALSECV